MSTHQNRTIKALTEVDNLAWPEIQSLIHKSSNDVKVLSIEPIQGEQEIYKLQVTARSYLGSVGLNCGGIITNHGWLRVLGGGHKTLPSISQASGLVDEPIGALVVGYDVTGGVFALDGGGLGFTPGNICYLSLDTLEWQDLDISHSFFVHWAIDGGNFAGFYRDFLWKGWEEDIKQLPTNYGYFWFPPPSTTAWVQNSPGKAVPLREIAAYSTGIDLSSPN